MSQIVHSGVDSIADLFQSRRATDIAKAFFGAAASTIEETYACACNAATFSLDSWIVTVISSCWRHYSTKWSLP